MIKKRILIIDDEKDVVDILQTMLEDLGYDAYAAYDGVEGLEKMRLVQPDLVILDINMPKLGGVGVYHEIYDHKLEGPRFPVIILSARYQAEKLFDGLKAEGFCAKPFKLDDLIELIENALKKHSSTVKVEPVVSNEIAIAPKPASLNSVLIVEQNPEFSKELVRAFKSSKCKASSVNDTFMVVERVLINKPDLLMIQIQLDDMKGDELAYKLKQMPELRAIPTLIYTHKSNENLEFSEDVYVNQGISPLVTNASCAKLINEAFKYMDFKKAS